MSDLAAGATAAREAAPDPTAPRHPEPPPPSALPVAPEDGVVEVARVEEIPPGWAMTVRAGSRPIAIANRDGELFAFENACPHAGGPLGDSRLKDGCLVCPWHDSAFDAGTGAVVRGPSRKPVKAYELTVKDGLICVHAGAVPAPSEDPG